MLFYEISLIYGDWPKGLFPALSEKRPIAKANRRIGQFTAKKFERFAGDWPKGPFPALSEKRPIAKANRRIGQFTAKKFERFAGD